MKLLLMKKALGSAPVAVITAIAVTTPPNKVLYTLGETFDSTGMVVTATYSDETTALLDLGECTFSPSGALTMEDSVITVSYGEFSDTQAIAVKQTLAFKPVVAADTGLSILDTETFDDGSFGVYRVGVNGFSCNIFTRFVNVTVPKNANILSAQILYYAESSETGAVCNTLLHMNDVDNAVAPISVAQYEALALTSNPTAWIIPATENSAACVSPDIKAAVQSIVNRAGWISGNAMTVVHRDNLSDEGAIRFFYASLPGIETVFPQLIVEFTY
jgi:hypothetical protein